VRRFSISPDGQRIAFEKVSSLDGPSDLWVMQRDGSDAHLVARNAAYPAWNPQRP
jgi:Tol biopolymer transport system component